MSKRKTLLTLVFMFGLLGWAEMIYAAGFIDHLAGTPYTWKTGGNPIEYRVENGDVSTSSDSMTTIDNAQGKVIVSQSLAPWAAAPLSQGIAFLEGPNIDEDITAANYENYVRFNARGVFENLTPDTIIIFDKDGGILEDLVGGGQAFLILGLASPGSYNDSDFSIDAGFVIINGVAGNGDADQIRGTLTHEIGHLLNLSHTQINTEEALNDDPADDVVIPTMFPYLPDDPNVLFDLHRDDIFSMSMLYPNSTAISSKGRIRGRILERTGKGVRGVNVICRSNTSPRVDAVSWVSDFNLTGSGDYSCGNLDDGDHTVEIEALELAVNVFNPDPPHIPSEFYDAQEDFRPHRDDRSQFSLVTVSAGNTMEDIDIVVNEDGRLQNIESRAGKTRGTFADYDYFIEVPKSAKSLVVEMSFADNSADLDLHMRCTNPFSLTAGLTSPHIDEQALISSNSETSNVERIELSKNSSPPLQDCTYYILVQNFGEGDKSVEVDFNLSATVVGISPILFANATVVGAPKKANAEVLVGAIDLIAQEDHFAWNGGKFYDQGTDDFSGLKTIRLYRDADNDRSFNLDNDELIASVTAFDALSQSFEFDALDEWIEKEKNQRYFISYEFENVPQTAGAGSIGLYGALIILLMLSLRSSGMRFNLMILGLTIFISCQNKNNAAFQPQFLAEDDVKAAAISYPESAQIRIGEPRFNNVNEFFTR